MIDIFENRAIDENQIERVNKIKGQADNLYIYILEMCPGNKEQSIAIAKLEESVMWATKSVAHGRKNN